MNRSRLFDSVFRRLLEAEVKDIPTAAGFGVGRIIEGTQFLGELLKDLEHTIQILFSVRAHEARTHDGLAITNRGINGGGGEDAFLVEALREVESLGLATNENRHDRGLSAAYLEPDALEALVHLARIAP